MAAKDSRDIRRHGPSRPTGAPGRPVAGPTIPGGDGGDPSDPSDRGPGAPSAVSPAAVQAGVRRAQGPLPSFVGETETLRRRRLLASAVFLASMYGAVGLSLFLSNHPGTMTADGSRFSLRVGMAGLRCGFAAAVAVLLASKVRLRHRPLRVVEYTLFLGLTLLYMASQYFVGLDLIRRGLASLPTLLTFQKNFLIQMLVLMAIYGTLIPNPATVAARPLAIMFIGPIIQRILLFLHPEVASSLAHLAGAEDIGMNVLYLAIGMALAVYGAFLNHGLRAQLHQARKLGQYRLVRKLGEGGMGEVYLAEHQLLKRPCALKRIRADAGSDPIALARFEREVHSAARLSHPNAVDIYDYGRADDGTFYYVMEYLAGLTLLDLVKRAGPLPPGRAIYLFRQVCAGLAEAHAMGLVHRDLKPANLMIGVQGGEADFVKVLDFGIVKVTQGPDAAALTVDNSISGTPMFMAPEQATGDRSLDARADIYALGGMLYYALTGRPPFAGTSPMAVIVAHLRDPVVPPSRHRRDLPEDLEQVVLRCLAKDPGERFPTVRALGAALSACPSAADWGPNRADAWWSVELETDSIDVSPRPEAARPVACSA